MKRRFAPPNFEAVNFPAVSAAANSGDNCPIFETLERKMVSANNQATIFKAGTYVVPDAISRTTVERYGHILGDDQRLAMEQVQSVLLN